MLPLEPTTRLVLRVVVVVLTVVGTLLVIWLLRRPLSWIILAAFVAMAVSGPVNLLSRTMPRGLAIATTYLLLFLIPAAIAASITPSIVNGTEDLAHQAPDYVQRLRRTVNHNPKLRKLDRDYKITDKLQKEAGKLPNRIGDAAKILGDIGIGLVNSIFTALTITVLSIFMVASGRGWIDAALVGLPPPRRIRIEAALANTATAVGNYVGGLIVQMTIAGLTTFIVLTILGVPFAAPLGVVVALLDAVPLVGATLGAIVVGIVTLFTDFPTATIVWVIWAILYQQFENYVIQPRIQSRAVDVQPFVVLVSVLFGSTLFGIVGALLAIPAAATVQIGLKEYIIYRREVAQTAAGPPPPTPPPGTPAIEPG